MKQPLKRFIVRKYIMARSAHEALKVERKYRPDDCFVDTDWMRENPNKLESVIGFSTTSQRDYED